MGEIRVNAVQFLSIRIWPEQLQCIWEDTGLGC